MSIAYGVCGEFCFLGDMGERTSSSSESVFHKVIIGQIADSVNNQRFTWRMLCVKIVQRAFTSFHICKGITFPLITKFKSNMSLGYLSVNRIPN